VGSERGRLLHTKPFLGKLVFSYTPIKYATADLKKGLWFDWCYLASTDSPKFYMWKYHHSSTSSVGNVVLSALRLVVRGD